MTAIRNLKVEIVSLLNLTPNPRNPRIHSWKQIQKIVESILAFGWTLPILIDADNVIIAGHGRFLAAKALGLAAVPVLRIDDMTPTQRQAYMIADNKLAEESGWDREQLSQEFQVLLETDLDFNILATGFDMGEIDVLIEEANEPVSEAADDVPVVQSDSLPVTQPGTLWQIGPHRLLCGNALDPSAYDALLNYENAQMVFTDPPYNVPIDGHVCGLGAVKHADFPMASGEMTEVQFSAFLKGVLQLVSANSFEGAILDVCMDWRHLHELLTAGRAVDLELKNLCVWNKTNGGMGSLYRSKHELVAVFKSGKAPHINNVALGSHGRYRSNVWDYAGANTFSADRDETLAMHPTVKSVALVKDAILDCSNRGGIILDPFAGSGTTLIAAEQAGRVARCMELDPNYVDVAIRRFRSLTGIDAVDVASGRTFSDLETDFDDE